jgi:branched-chain amino acid aminotransferase
MTAKCFLDGGIVDQLSAGIALLDRGFTLGDGVFETFRVRDGAVVDIPAHLERLTAALDTLAFPQPDLDRDLAYHLNETRKANGIA